MEPRAPPAASGPRESSSDDIIDAGAIAVLPSWALFMGVPLVDFGERSVHPMRKVLRADGGGDAGGEGDAGGCFLRCGALKIICNCSQFAPVVARPLGCRLPDASRVCVPLCNGI